jgi:hypothetical protein
MRSLIFCLFFCSSQFAFAQNEITVLHTNGKVMYTADGSSKATQIFPGDPVSAKGSIQCQANSSVKLLCKGKTFEFNDTRSHGLTDEVLKKAGDGSSLSFTNRFWNFLTTSMEGSEDEHKLEEHHHESMEKTHAGVKGYATGDFAMGVNVVYIHNFGEGMVQFKWDQIETNQYCFVLTRQSDDGEVARIWTSNNSLHLNLEDLPLKNDAAYEWQVFSAEPGKEVPSTPKILFSYQPETLKKTLERTKGLRAYQDASDLEKALMEAFALEEAGFYYSAANAYQHMDSKFEGNMLVRRAKASFLARIDQLDEAKALIN